MTRDPGTPISHTPWLMSDRGAKQGHHCTLLPLCAEQTDAIWPAVSAFS